MQLPFSILASGDSWIGLLIFIIIAVVSSLGKKTQQGQEMEMPEELPPRPLVPPHRAPVVTQRPVVPKPQQTRQNLTEEQVQEVLRRMRKPAQQHVPPPVIEVDEAPPRRSVKLSREESQLPSARLVVKTSEVEPPPPSPEPSSHDEAPSTAQLPKLAASVAALSPRKSPYHDLLRSHKEARRAIVLRELLGPPLALRQDW